MKRLFKDAFNPASPYLFQHVSALLAILYLVNRLSSPLPYYLPNCQNNQGQGDYAKQRPNILKIGLDCRCHSECCVKISTKEASRERCSRQHRHDEIS